MHKKLTHLSTTQIEEIIQEYYNGCDVQSIVDKFKIKTSSSSLILLLPPEEILESCIFCELPLHRKRCSRNNISNNNIPFCQNCGHEKSLSCSCSNCKFQRYEKIKIESDRKRKVLNEYCEKYSPITTCLPKDISLKTAVYILSFIRNNSKDDLIHLNPIDSSERKLSPTKKLSNEILEHLYKENLIQFSPHSDIETFNVDNNHITSYFPFSIEWRLLIGNDSSSIREWITQLEEIAINGSWPETWKLEAEALWRSLSSHENLEYLLYVAAEHNLEAPAGEKTMQMIENLTRDFSVGQFYAIAWGASKDAVAMKERAKMARKHASNCLIGICQRRADRARAEGYTIKSFRRNFNCPRSSISEILHDVFLKHGEKGFSEIIFPIYPGKLLEKIETPEGNIVSE